MYMLTLSAVLYLMPYLTPSYTYPCLFIWMLPLLYADIYNRYGFKEGVVWGMMFYSGHLMWLAYKIGIIAYLCAVAYLSLFSGMWLHSKQLVIKKQQENYGGCGLTWLFSTVAFIYITTSLSFVLFDCFEGYHLSNPLLPLTCWPWFVKPIFYFGQPVYLFIIVSVNLICYELLIKSYRNALIFFPALFLLLLAFQPPESTLKLDENGMIYVQPLWNNLNLSAAQKFYAISHSLDAVTIRRLKTRIVLMPESSFAHDLPDWADKLPAWTSLFDEGTLIFIGAHRTCGDATCNCLYQIQDGKITGWYDKQHLVFFTERIPSLFCKLISCNEFSYPERQKEPDILLHGFQPAICSEIFCGTKKFTSTAPILFICHDASLGLPYARDLGKLAARLVSFRYNVPVVYVGSYDMQIFC